MSEDYSDRVYSYNSGRRNTTAPGNIYNTIDSAFSFHPATESTGPQHDQVRSLLHDTAVTLGSLIPASPEATKAIGALQEAMMWANSAIAQFGVPTS